MAITPAELSQLRVRVAHPTDVAALARVHVAAWQSAYQGIIAAHNLARTTEDRALRRFRRSLLGDGDPHELLHVLDGPGTGVIGYVNSGPSRERELGNRGEVFELYLDPAFHGLGGGRKLLSAGLWALSADRLLPAVVWVLAANRPARRFYEGMRGRELGHGRVRVGDQVLAKVAYAWSDYLPWPEWIAAG